MQSGYVKIAEVVADMRVELVQLEASVGDDGTRSQVLYLHGVATRASRHQVLVKLVCRL